MAKRDIYRITVLGWEKYNGNMKKGHKSTLISNNFCADAKLRVVPVTVRWMFLAILLTCGNHTRDTIELSESSIREMLESSWSIERALESLQQLQVLTFEKITPFLNRIEEKRKEKKRKEEESPEGERVQVEDPPAPVESAQISLLKKKAVRKPKVSPIGQQLVAAYCESWKLRYGSSPPFHPKDAKALREVGETNGLSRTEELLRAFVTMNDPWFLKKRHSLGTFVENLPIVAHYVSTGIIVTSANIRHAEAATNLEQTLQKIQEDGI